MAHTIRMSLSGYNALTDTDINHYALYADIDNQLIKEKARGSANSLYGDRTTVAHGLGYVPMCLVWGEDGLGNVILQRISNAVSFSNMWVATMDSTNLYIDNGMNDHLNCYYFIFYDEVA